MCLASYLPGGMVVAIAVESITFYYIVVVDLAGNVVFSDVVRS